jgi:hypothetical protein
MLCFEDDGDAAGFVRWSENLDRRPHPAVERAAQEADEQLREKGWTRHGYLGDVFVPPGEFYVSDLNGSLSADNPRVMAGRWVCRCGYETDRLAHAERHMRLARQGAKLDRPGPHEVTEVERIGPAHDDVT